MARGLRLALRKTPEQGVIFQRWLHQHVLTAFKGRILSVDTSVALKSAAMHVPNPRPIRDALIAATAMVNNMQVVTGNVDDFAGLRLAVLNPWEPLR